MKGSIRVSDALKAGRRVTRRQGLALGAGGLAVALTPRAARAQTLDKAMAEIKAFTGGAEAVPGKVALDLPEIAENGNTVPMAISVASPMTAQDFVDKVIVVTSANPLTRALAVSFTPASGRAEIATRIRLAATQEVFAVARTNSGQFFIDSRVVKVTIGGCGG